MGRFNIRLAWFAGLLLGCLLAAAPAQGQFTDQRTWGGTSTGSANAQAVAVANYNSYLVGVPIRFIAGFTNTAATTVAINGLTPLAVKKQIAAGASVDLQGADITAGQLVTVAYDGVVIQLLAAVPPTQPGSAAFGGRLSLQSGEPVPTSSVSNATTVYYVPYTGQAVTLFNGVNAVPTNAAGELSIALGANWTTNSNWDVFVGLDGSTLRLCTGPAWTSSTARGSGAGTTELTRLNGLLLNANTMTCRYANASTFSCATARCSYLGTFRTASAGITNWTFGTSASGGGAAVLGVWNFYNQVEVSTSVIDSGVAYSYSGVTRQARGSAGNQVSFIVGLQKNALWGGYQDEVGSGGGATGSIGVGLNSTTTYTGTSTRNPNTGIAMAMTNFVVATPTAGWIVMSANQTSSGGPSNNFNSALAGTLSFKFPM